MRYKPHNILSDERLYLRHRRPISHPFPNAYSHPLPRFSYDSTSRYITINFSCDPTFPTTATRDTALEAWKDKIYLMTSLPLRKPRTIIDDASEILTSAISTSFNLLSGKTTTSKASADAVFDSGEYDLREDEILETERSEEGEVDDSYDKHREVRVVGISKEDEQTLGPKAKARRQWIVYPLRSVRSRTGSGGH